MSPTKELPYAPKASRRKRTTGSVTGCLVSSNFDDFDIGVEDAKQIRKQGQRLSNSDVVQGNWGRVQAVESDSYARALQVSDVSVEDFAEIWKSYAGALPALHHGSHGAQLLELSRQPQPAKKFDEELKCIIDAFGEVPFGTIVLKLVKSSEAQTRLRVVKKWLDEIGSAAQLNEPTQQDSQSRATVLERLEGFVEQIEGSIAYVTLQSEHGEELFGEYPADELIAKGIQERRRFQCQTIEIDGHVHVSIEAIPDCPTSEGKENAIGDRIDELLADDDLDGDY